MNRKSMSSRQFINLTYRNSLSQKTNSDMLFEVMRVYNLVEQSNNTYIHDLFKVGSLLKAFHSTAFRDCLIIESCFKTTSKLGRYRSHYRWATWGMSTDELVDFGLTFEKHNLATKGE